MIGFRPRVRRLSSSKRVRILSNAKDFRIPPSFSAGFCSRYLEALDCPRSLAVSLLMKYEEFDQLIDLDCDPAHYDTMARFSDAYSATCLLSKYADFPRTRDRKAVAKEKLLVTEVECWKSNVLFSDLSSHPMYTGVNVSLHNAVIRKIQEVLGIFVPISDILDSCNWGPGASTLLKRRDAGAPNKYQRDFGITRDLFQILTDCSFFEPGGFSPIWSELAMSAGYPFFFPGNQLEYVPKSSKTDRTIAIEPGLNSWFQKGVGSVIRKRLSKCGIDLNKQEINQRLARKGSVDDSLCTVDFSSASDLISRKVVEGLVSPQWFMVLDTLRSHYGTGLSDKPVLWEKLSSMGNGFTFELESLIFYAIAFCCCVEEGIEVLPGENLSVYGDDVIIPREVFPKFSAMCLFYGFSINKSKSFVSSDFRESCGAHFWRGVDVTPYYLKGKLNDISDVYKCHNGVVRKALYPYGRDGRFQRCCEYLQSAVPTLLQLKVPLSLGDCGFVSNFDEAAPERNKHGIEGFSVSSLVWKSKIFPFDGDGVLLASLWRLEHKRGVVNPPAFGRVQRRDRFESFSAFGDFLPKSGELKRSVATSIVVDWYDLGPWF